MKLPRDARTLAALAVAIVLVPLIAFCARTYPWHALYFDHSIYQYTAWSVRHGDRLYDAVAVPDGPFITWLHALIQIVAGESDRAFRTADLVIQTAGAVAIGAVMAPFRARAAWAAAIAALWLAQYFRYDWHWTAQRESYYALCGYLGMGLLLLAQRRRGRAMIAWSLAGGALVGSQLFGKHIGIIFIALGLAPAVLAPRGLRKRLALWAVAGVALAIACGFLLLAIWGDIGGFIFWYFEVPRPYRYIMGSADFFPLLAAIDRHTTVLAGLALVAGGACVYAKLLPRRYLGLAAAPAAFLLAMVLQRKGHIYQGHPVTAGSYLVFALIALHLVRHTGRARLAGLALVALLILDAARGLLTSSWIHPEKPTTKSQLGAAHVNHGDMLAAAKKLSEITKPDDRVLAVGPAGRLLYQAGRRSAVPSFANFFLNVRRAAIIELTPDQRANLEDVQAGIAERSCWRLEDHPAAVVVCDGADWSSGSGLQDAREICPALSYVVAPEYSEVGVYGCWHLLRRADPHVTPR